LLSALFRAQAEVFFHQREVNIPFENFQHRIKRFRRRAGYGIAAFGGLAKFFRFHSLSLRLPACDRNAVSRKRAPSPTSSNLDHRCSAARHRQRPEHPDQSHLRHAAVLSLEPLSGACRSSDSTPRIWSLFNWAWIGYTGFSMGQEAETELLARCRRGE